MSKAPPIIATEDPPQPRMGIIHLMAWTLGSAIILGVMKALDRQPEMELVRGGVFYLILRIVSAFLSGAGLGGIFIWLSRVLRGGPKFPIAPGHWLLFTFGCQTIVVWLGYAATTLWQRMGPDDNFSPPLAAYMLIWLAESSIIAILYFLAAMLSTGPRRWRVAFAMLVAIDLFYMATISLALVLEISRSGIGGNVFLFPILSWLQWLSLLKALPVIVAAVLDLRANYRRDWLHWTGVGVLLSSSILTVLWWIVNMILLQLPA